MTYLHFHLVFILPVIVLLALLVRRSALPLPRPFLAIATLCLIAVIYTTPWDDHLISIGIWTHHPERTIGITIGRIPIEEFAFFVLQPVLTGLFLLHFARAMPSRVDEWLTFAWSGMAPRVIGCATALSVCALGLLALWGLGDRSVYLGLILAWACPVISVQWAIGGNILWAGRRFLLTCLAGPTVYLWVVDMIAIEWGIWTIAQSTSTGVLILSLPIEEAVFFLVANLMVIQGLMLHFWVVRRFSHRASVGEPG